MILIESIKDKIKQAMFAKNEMEKNLLRLILGEAQLKNITDDDSVGKIIKKIIEANNTSLGMVLQHHPEFSLNDHPLTLENNFLLTLIPKEWTNEDVIDFINQQNLLQAIKDAKADGLAIKLVMEALKAVKAPVDGRLVKSIIAKLRTDNGSL